jgi:hypothetical protein
VNCSSVRPWETSSRSHPTQADLGRAAPLARPVTSTRDYQRRRLPQSIRTDKTTSLYLDALWAIQVVSSPARFDGSVTRSDPCGGRRRHGAGRARSSDRLPAIGRERTPVGVGSGIGVESCPCGRPEWPDRTGPDRPIRDGRPASLSGRPDRGDRVAAVACPRRSRSGRTGLLGTPFVLSR